MTPSLPFRSNEGELDLLDSGTLPDDRFFTWLKNVDNGMSSQTNSLKPLVTASLKRGGAWFAIKPKYGYNCNKFKKLVQWQTNFQIRSDD